MPRKYTVEFEQQSIAAASGDYDLFELDAAAEKPIAITGLVISTTSEIKEAEEEWLRLRIIRGHTTSGNGTSTTPRPLSAVDTAAGFTAETVASTPASAGTGVNLLSDAMQVRIGYREFWLPDDWMWTSGADLLVVRLMAAVLDDLTATGTVWVVEYP